MRDIGPQERRQGFRIKCGMFLWWSKVKFSQCYLFLEPSPRKDPGEELDIKVAGKARQKFKEIDQVSNSFHLAEDSFAENRNKVCND